MGVSPSDYTVTQALNGLSMQLEAGVALPQALKICSKGVSSGARKPFERAAAKAESGESFDDSLEQLTTVLSFAERAALSAGWAGGRVDEVIKSIVKRRDTLRETGRMIRGKMIQPALVLLVAAFIVPAVPLVQGKIDFNEFLFEAFIPLGIAIGTVIIARQLYSWRAWAINSRPLSAPAAPPSTFDYILYYVPLIWFTERQRNIAEFCDLLAYMLLAGMRIDLALKQCSRALPNGVYRQEVERFAEATRGGQALSDVLVTSRAWPEELVSVLAVAESSGDLEGALLRQGKYWRELYLESIQRWGTVIARLAYAAVSLYVIWNIFKMAAVYINAINNANNGVFPN